MINWEEMSTAPTDCKRILVYDGYHIYKAYFHNSVWYESTEVSKPLRQKPICWANISDLIKTIPTELL